MRKPPLMQRLRAKKKDGPKSIAGASWYDTEDTWRRVKETAVDSDLFESSYLEWVDMAANALRDIEATGLTIYKVPIDPAKFLAWCQRNSKQNCAASRAEFVSEELRTARP